MMQQKATSSYGTDSLLAGATVTLVLGTVHAVWSFRFEYPGFEAACVVLLSFVYSALAAWYRTPK